MALLRQRPAVFLDRDGVINEDLGYVHRPQDLRLLPGVPEALAVLQSRGYLLLVVTNQSGVARGLYTIQDVERFHFELATALSATGVRLDDFFYCPHHPEGTVPSFKRTCSCRKPAPGMVQAAARKHEVALAESYLVGDKWDDIECAVQAGVKGIQIVGPKSRRHPAACGAVASLQEALTLIPKVSHPS